MSYKYAQCNPVQIKYIMDNGFNERVDFSLYSSSTQNQGITYAKRVTPTDVYIDTGILENGVLTVTRRVCCSRQ